MRLYARVASVLLVGLVLTTGLLAPSVMPNLSGEASKEAYDFAREDVCGMSDTKHIEAKMDIQGDFIQITFSKLDVSSLRLALVSSDMRIITNRGFEKRKAYYSLNDSAEEAQITVKMDSNVYQKTREFIFTKTPRIVAFWTDPAGAHCSELLPFNAGQNTSVVTPTDRSRMFSTGGFLLVTDEKPQKTTATLPTGSKLTVYSLHKGSKYTDTNIPAAINMLSTVSQNFDVGCTDSHITWFSLGRSTTLAGQTYSNSINPSRSSDMWTFEHAEESIIGSLITHEYVHTRQCYKTTSEMEWLDEASAEYYADYLMYNSSNKSYYPTVSWGSYPNTSLTNSSSDRFSSAQYPKGKSVVVYLDYQIKKHSSKSFEDVMRWANKQNDPISYEEFKQKIVSLTNSKVGEWMDTNIDGSSGINPENKTKVMHGAFGCQEGLIQLKPLQTSLKTR